MRKGTLGAVAAICVLASAGRAHAQTAQDKAGAEVLFEEGKDLMRQKKFGLACPKFLESNRLDTGLGTMLWLAECYDKNGQSASAWGEFREAMDIAQRNHDAREKVARERSNRLEPTLSRMAIIVGPSSNASGMVVKRDNVEVGQTLWGEPVPVDPGAHTVTVTAPRKRPWETTVQVLRGVKNLEVQVPALEDLPTPIAPPPPLPAYKPGDEAPATQPRASSSGGGGGAQRAVGGVLIGLGLAAEGGGIGLYLFAKQQLDAADQGKGSKPNGCNSPDGFGTAGCNQTATNDREQAQNATTGEIISLVGGGVFVVTGIVLIIVAPTGSDKKSSSRFVPWFSPSGGGMSWQGAW
jgi:hypothetical protein